jgi:uncharacterized protein
MRVWIDLTNSPHVLVMRPVIDALRADGHDVRVTARDFAQTLGLLRRLQIPHTAIGAHRGEQLSAKALGLAQRSAALTRWALADARAARARGADTPAGAGRASAGPSRARGAARGRFDIALGHGSNDVSVAAKLLRIPCSTMFDYEYAAVQHHVNCRLADAVVVPDAIPPERLRRYGADGKIQPYAGLKEEYYLADFVPSPAVLGELGLDRARPIVVVRTPPEVSLYHRFENDLFADVLARLRRASAAADDADRTAAAGGRAGASAAADRVQPVLLPRTEQQRRELRAVPGFIVPEQAIDAQSLIAYADLVISAGGTMNREAVALGTPVYTTFEGRIGAVDEQLIAAGRLRRLTSAAELDLGKRADGARAERTRRDPRELVRLLLAPIGLHP